MSKNKLSQAFTVAELVVIIGVMALVLILAVISLPNVSAKGRALKTLDKVEAIRSALAMYRQDFGFFPPVLVAGMKLSGAGDKVYLEKVPKLDGRGNCQDSEFEYSPLDGGQSYSLKYCLEREVNQLEYGVRIASQVGLDTVESIVTVPACQEDSCGGSCGDCDAGLSCVDGRCQVQVCTPNCGLNYCGSDGCGGTCTCAENQRCESGACVAIETSCSPDCEDGFKCEQGKCVADCAVSDNALERMKRTCPSTPLIGCFCGGGTVICNKDTAVCGAVNLVVAPVLDGGCNFAEGEDGCQRAWKNNREGDSGTFSSSDGRDNHGLVGCVNGDCGDYPAMEACQNLSFGSYDDWYLPAKYEACAMVRTARETSSACQPAPDQDSASGWLHQEQSQALLEGMQVASYWNSTEVNDSLAGIINQSGSAAFNLKDSEGNYVRCLRRY